MKKFKNLILIAMIGSLLFGSIHPVSCLAKETIEDGIYTLPVALWNASLDQPSMGNQALMQTGKLVVENGKGELYLKFQQLSFSGMTGYLSAFDLVENITFNDFQYPQKYTLVSGKVKSVYDVVDAFNSPDSTDINCAGKKYPKVISVPVSLKDETIWAHVYVPVMGSIGFGDQLCRLHMDLQKRTAITEEESSKWKEYEQSTGEESASESTEKENAGVDKSEGQFDKNNLDDGKYSVSVYLWNAVADKASMGDKAISHEALLMVKGGVYQMDLAAHTMTVGTITACLQSIQIKQLDGSFVHADITARKNPDNQPSAFRFTLPSTEEYIDILIDPKVEIMGKEPIAARLKISWETLKKVDDNQTLAQSTDNSSSQNTALKTNIADTDTKTKEKEAASNSEEDDLTNVEQFEETVDYFSQADSSNTGQADMLNEDISEEEIAREETSSQAVQSLEELPKNIDINALLPVLMVISSLFLSGILAVVTILVMFGRRKVIYENT